MNIIEAWTEDRRAEDAYRRQWQLGEYTGVCPKCNRSRLCICENKKHRCEKCNWSPEENEYIGV